jgi:hypothetical protein
MYLTPVQNGVYRVNHELSLTGMRVSLPSQQDFQNEFSVISHTRSFSLAARYLSFIRLISFSFFFLKN